MVVGFWLVLAGDSRHYWVLGVGESAPCFQLASGHVSKLKETGEKIGVTACGQAKPPPVLLVYEASTVMKTKPGWSW